MKRLNRLWSRRRSWSSPGPSWPPENAKNTQIWKIWKRQKHTNFEKIYRQLEELVRYISCRITQSLSRWVRENHRGNRDLQRVAGCLQTGGKLLLFENISKNHLNWAVGEVNYHPKAVHLLYQSLKSFSSAEAAGWQIGNIFGLIKFCNNSEVLLKISSLWSMKEHLKWLYVFGLVPVKVSNEQNYLSKSSETSMDRRVPWFVHQARVRPAINIFKLPLASTTWAFFTTRHEVQNFFTDYPNFLLSPTVPPENPVRPLI